MLTLYELKLVTESLPGRQKEASLQAQTSAQGSSLVARMRLSIGIIAGLAFFVVGLSALALYEVGKEREELIEINLSTLLELDRIHALLPRVVSALLLRQELAGSAAPLGESDIPLPDLNITLAEIRHHAERLAEIEMSEAGAEFAGDLEVVIAGAEDLAALDKELDLTRGRLRQLFDPVAQELETAERLIVEMREEADIRLKSSDTILPDDVRRYVLLENALRELYATQVAFDNLSQTTSQEDVARESALLRIHVRDIVYILARLSPSEQRQSLVQAVQRLRALVFETAVLSELAEQANLLDRATVNRNELLLNLEEFQNSLTQIAESQAELVFRRGEELSNKTRFFYGLLITLALGVLLATGLASYQVLEKGVARRIRALEKNLDQLKAGTKARLALHGPTDELTRINEALNELRRQTLARDRMEADLRSAMEQATETAQAKTQFLSTMSHEVRTPLNAIIGLFELLETSAIPERQQLRATNGKQAGEKLLGLLNNVLDASRIDTDALHISHARFDASDLRDDIETALEGRAARSGSTVTGKMIWPADIPKHLFGDLYRIRQVIYNLVDNAFRFTPNGTVTVEISFEPTPDATLRVAVRDEGIGIPADQIARIFEPFTQVEDGMRRKVGGSGLGLSISRSLVNLMGGSLSVTSEEGRGTEFVFTVPNALYSDEKPRENQLA
ncbi:His Kinase A (phospho-acceptor) domain-containing protein [Poseidonocella sedimentorum]|uniref:histidine kinase n=2 Tax=Poseidonocella sedimentorum TaxID=871652 RepID=A0A1I6DT80_9RHOB|nr:His Kinase A (phospho-acceptor) domain-containing protein [Poseidonocella sedimentorum]